MKQILYLSILLLGLSNLTSSCSIIDDGGTSTSTIIGTWDLVGINYKSSKHHNTEYKEWWVITENTITCYDYENDNEIDTFGPYEYKREGNNIYVKEGKSFDTYPSMIIISVNKEELQMEHQGFGFQRDWCVATYKKSRGNRNDLQWVN